MKSTLPALVVLMSALPASALAGSSTAWSRVTVPGSTVSVELPGPTEHRQKSRSTLVGHVVTDTLVAKDADGWCAATVTELPGLASTFVGESGLLGRARDSLLGDYHAETTRWAPVKRDGHDGMRLEFTTHRDPARPETGVAELFVADGHIVTVVTLRSTSAGDLDLARLFGSVDLPE
jgi:hypothetical protein